MTPFFITGSKKCGTTLLANMLDRNPQISVMWESYWTQPDSEFCVFNGGENAKRNGVVDVTPFANPYSHKFANCVESLFEEFAQKTQAKVVGDKWWGYASPQVWPLVHRIFPWAKVIHIVRHPLGAYQSGEQFKKRGIGRVIVEEQIGVWDYYANNIAPVHDAIVVKYESLCQKPLLIMHVLQDFLGIDNPDEIYLERPLSDPLPDRWYWITNSTDVPKYTPPKREHHGVDYMADIRQIRRISEFCRVAGYSLEQPPQ